MRFADPAALWWLLLVPVAGVFFAWALWRGRILLRRFADPALLPRLGAGNGTLRGALRALLFIAALGLIAVALARPQWGTRLELMQREGLDIVVVMDVSRSMYAEDIRPNRLARTKQELARFTERLDGDRVALVAFAGDAFLQCPLTTDYGAFRMFLDVLEPDFIQPQGTDIARAIEVGLRAFAEDDGRHRVMVLLSDGEDFGGRVQDMVAEAARSGVVIFTVGIGSTSGVPIPVRDASGGRAHLRDARGHVVTTRMDAELLAGIAHATGGEFYHAQPGRFEMLEVLREINVMERRLLESERLSRFEDRFQFPLAAAMLLLVGELLVPPRRRRKHDESGRFA